MTAPLVLHSLLRPTTQTSRRRRGRVTRRKSTQFLHPRPSLLIWFFILALLLLVHDLFFNRNPPDPGVPASKLPLANDERTLPTAYFGVNARFLFYTATYGQFNNQLVSLMHALLINRHADSVLVLPYTKMGKESLWDLKRVGRARQAHVQREMVGDYFNYTRLRMSEHVVLPSDFFESEDAAELFSKNITVNYRSGNAYRKLFAKPVEKIAEANEEAKTFTVMTPTQHRQAVKDVCDFSVDGTLEAVNGVGKNDRFTFLPIVFRRHSLNCSAEEKDWVTIRKALVPRNEYLSAVSGFMETLERPIMGLHLRVFLNGDEGNFTPQSFVDMLQRKFGNELNKMKTLFIAYSPSSESSREIVELLRGKVAAKVVDGKKIAEHFDKNDEEFGRRALAAVLMDMWVCVKSDVFLGRLGSSLSWNTVYWRQALREEYELSWEIVDRPLWYALRDFTTTGASRHEGHIGGDNSRTIVEGEKEGGASVEVGSGIDVDR